MLVPKKSVLRFIAIVSLAIPPISSATSAEDVRDWLDRMREAAQVEHYIGTFVYEHGDKLDVMRVVHQARPMMGEYEKLVSLVGDPLEIHRNNDEVTCYLPKNRSVMVDKSGKRNPFSVMLPDDVQALTAHYELLHTRDHRVAGRDCREVEMRPRDGYRYGHRLCLDQETNLLLSSEVFDSENKTVERTMYTTISFPRKIPASLLQVEIDPANYDWIRHDSDEPVSVDHSATNHWDIQNLPPGFRMSAMRPRSSLPGLGKAAHQRVYSDGLATVSVFIEPMSDSSNAMEGASSMGAANAYGRFVAGHQIMVVGDMPSAGVELIADAIRYVPNPE